MADPILQWIKQTAVMNTTGNDLTITPSVDASGNVYIGYYTSATVSGGTLKGGSDIVVAKLDANGNLVWIKEQAVMNSTGNEQDPFAAVDPSGNVYVSYHTGGTVSGGTFRGGTWDIVTFKLDTNGNMVWIRQQAVMNSAGQDLFPTTAVDSSGNVYVTYQTTGTVSGGTYLGNGTSNDIVVFKLDTNGNMVWIKEMAVANTTGNDINPTTAVDASGNAYVSYYTPTTVSGGTFRGGSDIVVFKLDINGNMVWIKQQAVMNSTGSEQDPSTAVDPNGNVYVSYHTGGTVSGGTLVGGTWDVVTFKLDTNGNMVWIKQQAVMNSTGADVFPTTAVDSSGNVYVTYQTNGTVSGGTLLGSNDIVMFKLDTNGNMVWIKEQRVMNSVGNDQYPTITVDSAYNLYIGYYTTGTVSGGTYMGSNDVVLMKFTQGVSSTVPGAPTAPSATAGNAQASVSWTAPASNGGSAITSYTVTSSPDGFTATTANGSTTTATVTGLSNGTAYTFTVVATNANGNSSASTASNSVTPSTVPGAPTAPSATAGNAQASVSWTAPASNGGSAITSYTVTSSPGGFTATTANGSTTTATVTGLTNGTAYTFTVVATNANGNSAESTASASVTPSTIPGAPTSPSATAGNAQATVSWTAPASNGGSAITSYTVTSDPGSFTATTANGSTTTATVTGLTNGTAYTFTVVATNANGNSSPSSASNSVTPSAGGSAPDAPTTVTLSRDNGSITVNWLAPFNTGGATITSYTVTASPGGATQTTADGTTTTATFTTPTITAGTSYTFTVTATNSAGTSSASTASAPIIAAVAPSAPLNVAATASDRYATVTWDAPSSLGGISVSSYTITSNPATTTATTAGERTVNFTGLTNGVAYTFTVTATNAVGTSSASAASASVTPAATPADAAVAEAIETPGALSTYIAAQSSTASPDLFLEVKAANTTQIINETIATTEEAQAVKVEFVDAMRAKVGASAGVNAVITVPAEQTTTLMETMAAGSIQVILDIPVQVVLPAFVGTNATVDLQNVVTDGTQYLHVELPVGYTLTLTDGAVTKVLTFTGTTLTADTETYQLGDEVQVGSIYYNIVALGSTTLHPLPSGQSFGDPYLTTLTGQTYKLPALNAPIRYYQGLVDGKLLTINATLRTVPSSDLSAENLRSFLNLRSRVPRAARATMAQRLLSESEDLCFFERVRITHGDRVLQLNIWDGKIRVEAAEGRFQTRARSTDGLDAASPYQRGYAGAALDISIAPGVKMLVAVYPTPLIRNGLVLMGASAKDGNGVLCNVLGAEDMRLASLEDETPVARVNRALKTTTETFVDHDGYRVRKVSIVRN